ncbi:hypothetical protein [Pilimelia columellifera]|uniref:Aminoglycoside phosphotransferase domain-containing protein n=1 Tax=Pilimelia columellifera subsp. columellifera TaxID=706583 RepID=A0ABN3NK67_9ACTN
MSPVRTAPAGLTAGDSDRRAAYLEEVLGVLYPTARADRTGGDPAVADYALVPDRRRPRLLVPLASQRVAVGAVRRYAEPRSTLARLKRGAVVAALRTGASRVLLPDRVRVSGDPADTIDGYLRAALDRDLHVSVHIGPARANRKPVLQLLTPGGETFAFAKLGTGPLTRALVRHEAAALTALRDARLTRVDAPQLLHTGQWRGHDIVVQSALPVWQPRAPLNDDRLHKAMREVAVAGPSAMGAVGDSPYWRDLRGRLAGVTDQPDGATLAAAVDRLVARQGDRILRYGAWHGDWAPWNMAPLSDTVLVWDWERYRAGVPLGYDALHHELQRRIETTSDAGAAVTRTLRGADRLLGAFDVPADGRPITALLYLTHLATRYLADRQAEAGARLGVLGRWLLPVLIEHMEER